MSFKKVFSQIVSLLALWFILLLGHASTLSVYTEPTVVAPGEVFNLIIELDENAPAGLPDFSPLQYNFHIHGTGHSASYVFSNGQSKASTRWTVTLLPKHTGKIKIPALQVGQARSKAFAPDIDTSNTSQTTASTQSIPTADQALFLKTQLSTKKPLLNQQMLYSVKIFHTSSILDAAYQPPSLGDALLVPLGNNQQTQVIENGRPYLVEEQQYALFPQKAGAHILFPPKFQALIYDDIPRRAEAHGKSISLDIQAIPEPFTQRNWLPAKALSLQDTYSQSNTHFTEGHTLTRTITLKVTGLLAELVPLIEPIKSDTYKIYPERPTFGNTVEGSNVVSKTEIKINYLLNHSGTITIPEQKITWFNTETQKKSIATLPEKILYIAPDAAQNSSDIEPTVQPLAPRTEATKKPLPSKRLITHSLLQHTALLAAILGIGFIMLLLKKILQTARQKKREKHIPIKALKKACVQNNPAAARAALLIWAKKIWPHTRILNLEDIIHQADDAALTNALHALSEALYHPKQTSTWPGATLIQAIYTFSKQQHPKRKKTKPANPLPPINPKI
jgi:hypothetical protein